MKKILTAGAFLVALSSTAIAGSFTTIAPTDPVVATPSVNWTGAYIGGELGDATQGAYAGYRVDFGTVVGGAEVGYNWGTVDSTTVEGTLGYDMGAILPYISGGYEWANNATEGFIYGAGIDYRVTNAFTVGAKLQWQDYISAAPVAVLRVGYQF